MIVKTIRINSALENFDTLIASALRTELSLRTGNDQKAGDALRWSESGVAAGAHVTGVFVEFTEGGEITRHLYNYTFDDNSSLNLRIYDSH